jgi:hypothetical protein
MKVQPKLTRLKLSVMYFNIGSNKKRVQWHDVRLNLFYGSYAKSQYLKSFIVNISS